MTNSSAGSQQPPPSGFSPIFRVSPVIEMIGPVYSRGTGLELELGIVRASAVFLAQDWP